MFIRAHFDTVLGLERVSYERMIRQDTGSVPPSPRFAESAQQNEGWGEVLRPHTVF